MITFTATIVVFSLLYNNVYTQTGSPPSDGSNPHQNHPEINKVRNEHYEISVMKDLVPTDIWSIEVKDRPNTDPVKNISIAIDRWTHMAKAPGSTTFEGNGYQGLKIKHFINGNFLHEFNLAICSNNLPLAIVHYTMPADRQNQSQLKADFKKAVDNKCRKSP
ncbi:uncharacterized protein LOC132758178 [Ruditapes philippinarum]|uniref:uncharacterized protein LOC132758178 n=1 Tax=Ruditapes philippinarum TaxID=129788 RepID=UPI00295AC11C|nr:uncharacterized protein LOC132758178 [Ruditapes philippinarum]